MRKPTGIRYPSQAAINNTKDIVPAIARPPMNPLLPDAPLLGWIGAGVLWICAACFLATMPEPGGAPPSEVAP